MSRPSKVVRHNDADQLSLLDNVQLPAVTNPEYWGELQGLSEVYTHYLRFFPVDHHEIFVSERFQSIQIFLHFIHFWIQDEAGVFVELEWSRTVADVKLYQGLSELYFVSVRGIVNVFDCA